MGFLEDAAGFIDDVVTAPTKIFGTERGPWKLMQIVGDGKSAWQISNGVDVIICNSEEIADKVKELLDKSD